MKIVIRMDDIAEEMDWAKFRRVEALLDQYNIFPLIGVVPHNKDEKLVKGELAPYSRMEFFAYVREQKTKGWVVAQHGYCHLYCTKKGGLFPLNSESELAGRSLVEQKEVLKKGKDILLAQGIDTDFFMAPAHSYDYNTLKALEELGFHKITDGFGNGPYLWRGLVFYPIAFRLESSLKKSKGITTMVLHCNTMEEHDFLRLECLLQRGDVVSYSEYMSMEAKKRGLAGRFLEYVQARCKYILVRLLLVRGRI